MATTTTANVAKNTVLKIDNAGGTLTDISGTSNSVSFDFTNTTEKASVFGDSNPLVFEGPKDDKISAKGLFSTTSTEAYFLLDAWSASGGARSIQVDTPNSSAGSKRYTAEVYLQNLKLGELDASSAKPIMWSAEFVPSGGITRATI